MEPELSSLWFVDAAPRRQAFQKATKKACRRQGGVRRSLQPGAPLAPGKPLALLCATKYIATAATRRVDRKVL